MPQFLSIQHRPFKANLKKMLGHVSRSRGSFSGPESYFMCAMPSLKIHALLILKAEQHNSQLTKQLGLVSGLITISPFNRL